MLIIMLYGNNVIITRNNVVTVIMLSRTAKINKYRYNNKINKTTTTKK